MDRCSITHITAPMTVSRTNGVGTFSTLPVASRCRVSNPAESPNPLVSSSAMKRARPRYKSRPHKVTMNGCSPRRVISKP